MKKVVCRFFLFIIVVAPLLGVNVVAEAYKWVDSHGRVHYGDRPAAGQKLEKIDAKVNSYESVSYKNLSGVNKGSSKDKVVMYSTAWCGYCKKARNYFRANNIAFVEYDIEKNPKAKKAYDALGGKGVPVIVLGKKRMNGFSPSGFDRLYQSR